MFYYLRRHILLILLLALVLGWSACILIIGPDAVREYIGIENGYVLLLLISMLGGASSLTSISYYSTLVALAGSGFSPLMLGIVAGIGEIVGDSIFYIIGYRGRRVTRERFARASERFIAPFCNWLTWQSQWVVALAVFFYSGFTPFPNDVVTVTLGVARYNFFAVIIPLFFGNATRASLIAAGVMYTTNLFF